MWLLSTRKEANTNEKPLLINYLLLNVLFLRESSHMSRGGAENKRDRGSKTGSMGQLTAVRPMRDSNSQTARS